MIELRQVVKRYDRVHAALDGIDLSVARGELIFLAGPSGAGKSTLLRVIAAIEPPTSGSILVNGQEISAIGRAAIPYFRRRLGLILQDQKLLADRSVLHNVMLPLLVIGESESDARRRAQAALERVGLLDKALARPPSLSGGEQQRVGVARAIVNRPQIILADEPTANLDRESAKRVLDALQSFHSAGVTCLISTHDEQFLRTASRVVFLDQGSVVDTWPGSSQESRP